MDTISTVAKYRNDKINGLERKIERKITLTLFEAFVTDILITNGSSDQNCDGFL